MEFVGEVARKRASSDHLAVEVAKTTCAARVGARTGHFHVPAVVRFDAGAGVLETERVRGYVSLLDLAIRRDRRLGALCERVGRALAEAHAEMRLPEDLHIPLPAPLATEPADDCVLHGDFNGLNIGYDASVDRIVILDWSAAPSLRVAATVGSRYFDILWFALFFFRFRPGSALIGWYPERWAGAFLAGYADAGTFSADALRAYHERARAFLTNDYRLERERWERGIRWVTYRSWQRLGWRRWEKFLASLSDSDPRVGPRA